MKPFLYAVLAIVLSLTGFARAGLGQVTKTFYEGVTEIVAPGAIPGPIAVFGEAAFVVLTAQAGDIRLPLIAATPCGKGRVVAFGHEAFVWQAAKHKGNERFLENTIAWAGRGKPSPQTLRVGTFEQGLLSILQTADADGVLLTNEDLTDLSTRLLNLNVLYLNQSALDGKPDAIRCVREWVNQGGGLILAGPGWGWKHVTGKDLATEQSANQLVQDVGLAWADGMLSSTEPNGTYTVSDAGTDVAHARTALAHFTRYATQKASVPAADLKQATAVLTTVVGALPYEIAEETHGADGRTFLATVTALCAKQSNDKVPTPQNPVRSDDPFARLSAVLTGQQIQRLPPEKITAHPASALFPGAVPTTAPRLKRDVIVDTSVPRWHSTGLYAAPGQVILVTVPPNAAKKGLAVRIGTHTDSLWSLDSWKRFPEITQRREINTDIVRVASPFGGAILLDVPENCRLSSVSVTIAGAVAAPFFVLGKTTLEEWKQVRNAPAPWAELVGKRCVLSVPSAVVRTLDNPEALMTYWDEVSDHCADLYGLSRDRKFPQRYCVDVQISAGYMHSGYPIMTHDDVAKAFVDLTLLRGRDGNKTWGFYHELGHNHQRPDWTWDGCGEVTNNLFSLYGGEMLNAVTPDYSNTHPAIAPAERQKRKETYLSDGAKYEVWKRDPFLALLLFLELRQMFGWEPFRTVFAEYERLPDNERPKTDLEKRDQFLLRFSRAVGKNLGPFFTTWGVPTSDTARQSLTSLPR